MSADVIGSMHPGSALYKLDVNPTFFVYHTVFKSSHTMFTVVTPCTQEDVRNESTEFANLIQARMENSQNKEIIINDLAPVLSLIMCLYLYIYIYINE